MELKRFILATAGHVDHGKSALVRALTGTDPDRLPEEKVRAQLRDTPFGDAAILRTSITTGSGVEELKAQLVREFSALVPQRDLGKPRLAVDRAFILRGIGTIITGTLVGGTLRRGQAVVVQPAKIPARIRTIQNHNREVEAIGPGTRTALSLPDVAVAREKNTLGVWRGDVVTF